MNAHVVFAVAPGGATFLHRSDSLFVVEIKEHENRKPRERNIRAPEDYSDPSNQFFFNFRRQSKYEKTHGAGTGKYKPNRLGDR